MENKDFFNPDDYTAKRNSEPLVMPPPPKASEPIKPYTVKNENQTTAAATESPAKGLKENKKTVAEPVAKPFSKPDPRSMTFNIPVKVVPTPKPPVEQRKAPEGKKATVNSPEKNSEKKKPVPEQKKEKTIGFSQSDYYDYAGYKRRKPKAQRLTKGSIIGRSAIVLASVILFAVIAVYSLCFTIAKGPSETVRNLLVLSAKQASATKWVPGLFLDSETIDAILANSEKVETDVISMEDYYSSSDTSSEETKDEWADAKDGMIFKTLKGSTYTAYMLIVNDPSRVFVGTSSDNYSNSQRGKTIFDAAADCGAVAAINGGEFPDSGGIGTGSHPIGLTYSDGECVWNDGTKRTFIGFDKNNKLIVREGMTKAEADALEIRDAVSFQTGNVLISSDGENVTFYYAEGNNGTAQRTAIGQRADGAVIMLVTDGRTASSLGATHNDVIDIMVEHGAVSAAMLDGGSSAMMYYENYYEKYDYDYEALDQYQKRGLVNKYKAFTTPRYMPTFFMVMPEDGGALYAGQ